MIKKLNPEDIDVWRGRLHRLFKGPAHSNRVSLVRYLLVAGIATMVDYLSYVSFLLILRVLDWPVGAGEIAGAVVLGFAVGGTLNYFLSLKWAFQGSEHGKSLRDQIVFWVTAIIGLGINWAVVVGLDKGLQVPPEIGRIPAIFIAFAWNFLSKKWFVFGRV
jgi:putative flippase GtrA